MISDCEFETDRLRVGGWHSYDIELEHVVMRMLTGPVTETLPPTWQGEFSYQRARDWIKERDMESIVLLAVSKNLEVPVGLVILLDESPAVRIGYLLSENVWGQGLGSELVAGFVDWCRGRDSITKISARVGSGNPASMRVLEKSGFRLTKKCDMPVHGDHLYEKNLP